MLKNYIWFSPFNKNRLTYSEQDAILYPRNVLKGGKSSGRKRRKQGMAVHRDKRVSERVRL